MKTIKEIQGYLAGKMSGLTLEQMNGWREEISYYLKLYAETSDCKITVVNPVNYYNFEEIRHQSEEEVEDFDLAKATSSTFIIVNLDGLNSSIGTQIELHDCNYHKRIPVIAFGDDEKYKTLHPWVKRDITRVEKDIYGACRYIKDFYMM